VAGSVVCISHATGSGGEDVGKQVAQRLGDSTGQAAGIISKAAERELAGQHERPLI
jgi:hypothetical protein